MLEAIRPHIGHKLGIISLVQLFSYLVKRLNNLLFLESTQIVFSSDHFHLRYFALICMCVGGGEWVLPSVPQFQSPIQPLFSFINRLGTFFFCREPHDCYGEDMKLFISLFLSLPPVIYTSEQQNYKIRSLHRSIAYNLAPLALPAKGEGFSDLMMSIPASVHSKPYYILILVFKVLYSVISLYLSSFSSLYFRYPYALDISNIFEFLQLARLSFVTMSFSILLLLLG